MSAPDDDTTAVLRDTAPERSCPRCGSPVRPDQDWCLNCGTAVTTEVAGAPGWRAPVVIVAAVLAVAAAALVFAFLQMSDDATRVAQAPAPSPAPAATPAPAPSATPSPTPAAATGPTGPTGAIGSRTPVPSASPAAPTPTPALGGGAEAPRPTPSSGTIASWPAGRTAWTVILFSSTTRKEAEDKAKGFQSQGKSVGVLHSDDYSSLRPGYWVVFSGQYDTQEEAQTAAEGFGATAPGAYARRVKPK
jgi:RNA polymerase subunit RPABC4/transcription elongation factor Spt4